MFSSDPECEIVIDQLTPHADTAAASYQRNAAVLNADRYVMRCDGRKDAHAAKAVIIVIIIIIIVSTPISTHRPPHTQHGREREREEQRVARRRMAQSQSITHLPSPLHTSGCQAGVWALGCLSRACPAIGRLCDQKR